MIVEQISARGRLLPGAPEGPNNWAHPCGRLRFRPARSNNHPPIQQPIICACRFPLSLVCVLSPNVYLAKTKGLRVLELKHKSKVRRSVYYAHRTTRIGATANGLAATSHGDVPCHHPAPTPGAHPCPTRSSQTASLLPRPAPPIPVAGLPPPTPPRSLPLSNASTASEPSPSPSQAADPKPSTHQSAKGTNLCKIGRIQFYLL